MAATIGGTMIQTDDQNDSDAIFIVDDIVVISVAGFVASIIVGAIAGGAVGYLIGSNVTTGTNTTYVRTTEASTVATSILTGMTYYSNALANYDQIWSLTDEHWIRQAELSSSFLWSSDSDFSTYQTLMDSGVYINSSYMLTNASAQIDAHFDSLSQRMALWNANDTYKDAMTLKWSYGLTGISSDSSFGGHLESAATITSDSADKVYISGGDFWVFGGSATITSSDGTSYSLTEGCNDLDSISGFSDDVYELQSGRQYAGEILPVLDGESATVTSGIVMESGSDIKLATYVNGKVVVNGYQYDSLSIDVIPEGGTTATADVTTLLSDYYDLIQTIKTTMIHASSAAMTVWNIYDSAGSASSYLTTLMVPNNYDNVEISQSQQEIITILAMEQLSQYYVAHSGDIKTGDYTISSDSLSLFCRGDIYDESGTKIYENVIFTPFFYQSDATLTNGDNDLAQSSIVAIWGTGTNLSGWDGSVSIDDTNLVTMSSGSSLNVYEMEYNGSTVSTMSLEQKDIDIIDPGEIDPTPIPPVPPSPGTDWTQIALIIIMIIASLVCVFVEPMRIPAAVVLVLCAIIYVILYYLPTINIWSFL